MRWSGVVGQDLTGLPSYFRGNPWLDILAQRGQEDVAERAPLAPGASARPILSMAPQPSPPKPSQAPQPNVDLSQLISSLVRLAQGQVAMAHASAQPTVIVVPIVIQVPIPWPMSVEIGGYGGVLCTPRPNWQENIDFIFQGTPSPPPRPVAPQIGGQCPPITPHSSSVSQGTWASDELETGDTKERWPVISWPKIRAEFMEWSRRIACHSEEHRAKMVSYLDRYVSVIRGPEDLKRVLLRCERGRRHLQVALKNLFKFLVEWKGWPEEVIKPLRDLVRVDKPSEDDNVPDEEDIIKALRTLGYGDVRYLALYNLMLDSGIRLRHAVELLRAWDDKKLKACDGFYIYNYGKSRGPKKQRFVFLTPYTVELIHRARAQGLGRLTEDAATNYYRRRDLTMPKYVRKFVYSKLIALGVPESLADFIEGRELKTVGARSYLAKLELAKAHYGRYARYLAELRAKAGLTTN